MENKSSITALMSAFGRAFHAENEEHPVFKDYLAKELLTAEEYSAMLDSSKGDFVGIGVHACYDEDTGGVYIFRVMPDSPAQEAGILDGDVIVEAAGTRANADNYYDIIDLIRGKNVDEALAILQYTPKAASPVVYKLLSSAVANAVNNQEMDRSTLYVAEVYANPGPTLKRYVARSRGSASPMLRRTSHISVILDEKK